MADLTRVKERFVWKDYVTGKEPRLGERDLVRFEELPHDEGPRRMNQRFVERMMDLSVIRDTTTLGDFVVIWCDGHHGDRQRGRVRTDGAQLGIYGDKVPVLCKQCEAHLAYAEKRRAYCPQDPKPFCAYCETHCYKSDERTWQREMMRYSGPRSWRKGHAVDGIKHLLDGRKYKKLAEAKARAASATTREES